MRFFIQLFYCINLLLWSLETVAYVYISKLEESFYHIITHFYWGDMHHIV